MNTGTTTCTVIDASTTQCVGPVYTGPTYEDWLLVAAIIVFALIFATLPRLNPKPK